MTLPTSETSNFRYFSFEMVSASRDLLLALGPGTDLQRLLAGVVHPEGLLPLQRLIGALLHHVLRVSTGVQVGQQLAVDEGLHVVDDEEHDALGDHVPAGAGDDLHVAVHQVPDSLHLSWIRIKDVVTLTVRRILLKLMLLMVILILM